MTTDSVYERTKTMYDIIWSANVKILLTILSLDGLLCGRDRPYVLPRLPNAPKAGDDPCNPLYWYPRTIPEYCYKRQKNTPSIISPYPSPVPIPVPVPLPPPLPPLPPLPIINPLPFGLPLAPTNPMLPIAGIPYPMPPIYPAPLPPAPLPMMPPPPPPSPFASYIPPYGIQRMPMSMMPGLPGLVSPDGGINILPFSDAYADLIEKHKQRMIRKRLQKLLDEYDDYPWKGEGIQRRNMRRSNNDVVPEEDNRRMNTRRRNSDDDVDVENDRAYHEENDIANIKQSGEEREKLEDLFQRHEYLEKSNPFEAS